jgi:hypothetical protein
LLSNFQTRLRALPLWKKGIILLVVVAVPAGFLAGLWLSRRWLRK